MSDSKNVRVTIEFNVGGMGDAMDYLENNIDKIGICTIVSTAYLEDEAGKFTTDLPDGRFTVQRGQFQGVCDEHGEVYADRGSYSLDDCPKCDGALVPF